MHQSLQLNLNTSRFITTSSIISKYAEQCARIAIDGQNYKKWYAFLS